MIELNVTSMDDTLTSSKIFGDPPRTIEWRTLFLENMHDAEHEKELRSDLISLDICILASDLTCVSNHQSHSKYFRRLRLTLILIGVHFPLSCNHCLFVLPPWLLPSLNTLELRHVIISKTSKKKNTEDLITWSHEPVACWIEKRVFKFNYDTPLPWPSLWPAPALAQFIKSQIYGLHKLGRRFEDNFALRR